MSSTNHISRVAIVGATGRIGSAFAAELLKTGKHTVTALTRASSTGTLPSGIHRVNIDYDDESSLVNALKGQDILVITLSVQAAPDIDGKLVSAAAKAGVKYVMPNAYGGDPLNEKLGQEDLFGARSLAKVKDIEAKSVSSWIVLTCGFWYEWSLALGEPWFGFTIKERKVTFFDDGKLKLPSSTWEQCGRALAGLLSLPETSGSGSELSLSNWRNKPVYIASFYINQRDVLDSLHRVLGTTDADWEIKHEETGQRYQDGLSEMKQGIRTGFAKAMYTRHFFKDGGGDYSKTMGLDNEKLGLKMEDLDASTKKAVEMVESGWTPFG